jgi:hypothetical protein
MNSEEIERILRRVCGETFIGVYAKDQLPTLRGTRPVLMVVNTDNSNKPGTHWIAMFINTDGSGEYFDSFGELNNINQTFTAYMNKYCAQWVYNDTQLQSVVSKFCGHYCIFYCLYRSIGYNINSITALFTRDYGLNDLLVHEFVCRRMK